MLLNLGKKHKQTPKRLSTVAFFVVCTQHIFIKFKNILDLFFKMLHYEREVYLHRVEKNF